MPGAVWVKGDTEAESSGFSETKRVVGLDETWCVDHYIPN